METNERKCPNCGNIVDKNSFECDFCQTQIKPEYDPKFNSQVDDEGLFRDEEDEKKSKSAYKKWMIFSVAVIVIVFLSVLLFSDKNKKEESDSQYRYTGEDVNVDIPGVTPNFSQIWGTISDDGSYTGDYWGVKFTPFPHMEMDSVDEINKINSDFNEELKALEAEQKSTGEDYSHITSEDDHLMSNIRLIGCIYDDEGILNNEVSVEVMARKCYENMSAEDWLMIWYGDEEDGEYLKSSNTVKIAGEDYLHISYVDEDGYYCDEYIRKKECSFFIIGVYSLNESDEFRHEVLNCFEPISGN